MATQDYSIVTEISGEKVSRAQIRRLVQRYRWAGTYSTGKDVFEVACGAGQGLGHLASVARSLAAGDITPALVDRARRHYGARVAVDIVNAQTLPLADASIDVLILFEAIYYLPSAEAFVAEARRVLRVGGHLLLATANKDLFDFNPSPFAERYFSVPELDALLRSHGFDPAFFGGSPVSTGGVIHGAVRVAKRAAVALHLIPKTMRGKQLLKRLVFGKLVTMPAELPSEIAFDPPVAIPAAAADRSHQVIYCAARRL